MAKLLPDSGQCCVCRKFNWVKIDEYSVSFSSWNATTHVCTPAQSY